MKTTKMDKDDIKYVSCADMVKHICYSSEWNIMSAVSTAKSCQTNKNVICVSPKKDQICSVLPVRFTPGPGANCSFEITENITIDFLDVTALTPTVNETIPATISTDLPNCANLTVDYTCQGPKISHKNVSELEPFTNYSCKGQLKKDNAVIGNVAEIPVYIKCDLNINVIATPSNTSIALDWTTDSKNCQLSGLQGLSYKCFCDRKTSHSVHGNSMTDAESKDPNSMTDAESKNPNEGTCKVPGLTPFIDYKCFVQPFYNDEKVAERKELDTKTDIGVPDPVENLSAKLSDNNAASVSCLHSGTFYASDGKLMAKIYDDNTFLKTNNQTECQFEFRDLSYHTTYTVEVFAFNGRFMSHSKRTTVSTTYNNKAVIGFLIFLIILTSVALLLVIYKIFILKHRKSHDMTESMMLIQTANDEENLMNVQPIPAELLLETYKRKLADDGRLFLAEFQSIPRIFSRFPMKDAKKPCNTSKNRYVDILPYDENRVHLTTGNGEPGCDYINASFIDGFKECKKYIAAQGPKDETVSAFWRMVWEQQSSIIVMVTRCEEGNKVKCAQYWPAMLGEAEIFEEFIVKLNAESCCPDYTIRHLNLINKREKNSEREVTHIQFMSWPDHGVPDEPHLLLKLRRRVNTFKNVFSGPIIIHCSAGVGRTGTYIGIDAMMEGLEAEGRVDIYGYVVRLRKQRCLMVQVEAQYILIHQALLEHNQFGETEIALCDLHSTLSTLKQENSDSEPMLLQDEFERLPTYKNWRTFNTGVTEENKKKNRSPSVIPYDYNRVLVKLSEEQSEESYHDEDGEEYSSDEDDEESTKYINASHISGYWGPRSFITAQTPLLETTADFLMMIYQKKTLIVVMFSDGSEDNKESDSVYWGTEKKTFGEIEVEVTSTDTSPTYITRNLLISHIKRKESRQVKQFHFVPWGKTALPEKPDGLINMIKDMKKVSGFDSSRSQRSSPIVVHCSDGSSQSGVFCALWNLLDSAKMEKMLDVFQVAKALRKERQGMISSLDQYQFLYDTLQAAFPVQNGDLKAVSASQPDSIQIVSETKTPEQAEQPAGNTSNKQQGAADTGNEDSEDEPEATSSSKTTPLEDTSNGSSVPLEV
ncbi:receptor-type tyrosine-protein phosphatase C [Thalassophryne amazonica]|uniref:receptor-type tyrosine-protein phosphatase C n=1 Tax=Thalassophryne amazonica TaxID=390379 RepID=UPI001471C324|nr:receptor-type tyrosine-protein phosphatase C [Thalassophryne amazonica]